MSALVCILCFGYLGPDWNKPDASWSLAHQRSAATGLPCTVWPNGAMTDTLPTAADVVRLGRELSLDWRLVVVWGPLAWEWASVWIGGQGEYPCASFWLLCDGWHQREPGNDRDIFAWLEAQGGPFFYYHECYGLHWG